MAISIDYLGEGASDAAVARRLIAAAGHSVGTSYFRPISGTGKQNLDSRLNGLNRGAADGRTVLVLRDLDRDAPCPSALIERKLPKRHRRLLLRVAVPETESWLIADRAAYASCCGIRESSFPNSPEQAGDLKLLLMGLAAKHRRSQLGRHVSESQKRGLEPWQTLGEWHTNFAAEHWDPHRAASSGRAPPLTLALA